MEKDTVIQLMEEFKKIAIQWQLQKGEDAKMGMTSLKQKQLHKQLIRIKSAIELIEEIKLSQE